MARKAKKSKAVKRPRKAPKAPPASFEDVSYFRCEHGADELVPAKSARKSLAGITVPKQGNWRIAKSLETLRAQINLLAPNRKKASDGGIGDFAHWKNGSASDHNPWIMEGKIGVVTARDFTHDPTGGCDCHKLVASLVNAKDSRVKYIIWDSHIYSSASENGAPPWAKRKYSGENKHNKHAHVSVKPNKASYDSASKWTVAV